MAPKVPNFAQKMDEMLKQSEGVLDMDDEDDSSLTISHENQKMEEMN
jgi:hypothetical protein